VRGAVVAGRARRQCQQQRRVPSAGEQLVARSPGRRVSDDPVQRGTRAAVDRRVLLLRTSRLPQGAGDVDLRGGESVVTRHLTIHDARVCSVTACSVRGTLESSTYVARGAARPAVPPLPDLFPIYVPTSSVP